MSDDVIVKNLVRSTTTDIEGRCVNRVGDRDFEIHLPGRYGGPPPEAITPADAFLAGISSCAALLIESMAQSEHAITVAVDAEVEGQRDAADTSWFTHVDVRVTVSGCDEAVGNSLVEAFTHKCPLYRTVAAATDVSISWTIVP